MQAMCAIEVTRTPQAFSAAATAWWWRPSASRGQQCGAYAVPIFSNSFLQTCCPPPPRASIISPPATHTHTYTHAIIVRCACLANLLLDTNLGSTSSGPARRPGRRPGVCACVGNGSAGGAGVLKWSLRGAPRESVVKCRRPLAVRNARMTQSEEDETVGPRCQPSRDASASLVQSPAVKTSHSPRAEVIRRCCKFWERYRGRRLSATTRHFCDARTRVGTRISSVARAGIILSASETKVAPHEEYVCQNLSSTLIDVIPLSSATDGALPTGATLRLG